MSAGVNVLAVLVACAGDESIKPDPSEVRAAHAAVVELIDVASHVALWMDDTPKRDELRLAIERVRGDRV